jgi:hypothetical protein
MPLSLRHEAFARHVASGASFARAARMAGYAWNSARQTGSRLMRDPGIAARVVELSAAEDHRRRAELDELAAAAKRILLDAMEKQNFFAALRAIDRITTLRDLEGPKIEARAAAFDAEPDDGTDNGPTSSIAEPEAQFEPPMPPAIPAPVEPAPDEPDRAHRKMVNARNLHQRRCLDLLTTRHPDIRARLRRQEDAHLYFDDHLRLLPSNRWPQQPQQPPQQLPRHDG